MKNHSVKIDEKKCIGCGLCVKDCVSFDLSIVDGKAKWHNGGCIGCGHCEAICPKNAVSLSGFNDATESFRTQTRLKPETLMKAIKSRRTIRSFTQEKISQEIIDDIIEAGRMAPTGTNAQKTSFVILDQKKSEFEAIGVKMFRGLFGFLCKIVPMVRRMKIDDDFFFKRAPLVIVVMGKDKVSASLAAENMAFMAEAHGLGVLFSGFFTVVAGLSWKISRQLKKAGKGKPVTTLVIGHPAVKYYRTVHRKDAVVAKI